LHKYVLRKSIAEVILLYVKLTTIDDLETLVVWLSCTEQEDKNILHLRKTGGKQGDRLRVSEKQLTCPPDTAMVQRKTFIYIKKLWHKYLLLCQSLLFLSIS